MATTITPLDQGIPVIDPGTTPATDTGRPDQIDTGSATPLPLDNDFFELLGESKAESRERTSAISVSPEQMRLLSSFKNPKYPDLNSIAIFQRIYMGYGIDDASDATGYGLVIDGSLEPYGSVDTNNESATITALNDCLQEIEETGSFAIYPGSEEFVPEALQQTTDDSGTTTASPTETPWSDVSRNLHTSTAGAQPNTPTQPDPPAITETPAPATTAASAPARTITLSEQGAINMTNSFLTSSFLASGAIEDHLNALAYEYGLLGETDLAQRYNFFWNQFHQLAKDHKPIPEALRTEYNAFVSDNYDLLYPMNIVGSGFSSMATPEAREQAYSQRAYLFVAMSTVGGAPAPPSEDFFAYRDQLAARIKTVGFTQEQLDQAGIADPKTATMDQLKVLYREVLWDAVVEPFAIELQSQTDQAAYAYVQSFFTPEHLYEAATPKKSTE